MSPPGSLERAFFRPFGVRHVVISRPERSLHFEGLLGGFVSYLTKWTVAIAVVVIAATAGWSRSQEPTIEQVMQRKLDHAHGILEALIMEDYETLEDSAIELRKLSEEAAWLVLQTPEYAQRSAGFRQAAEQIEVSAKEHNLEGAALGYVDMTLKCVQCHELLRGSRMAGEYAPALGETAQLQ